MAQAAVHGRPVAGKIRLNRPSVWLIWRSLLVSADCLSGREIVMLTKVSIHAFRGASRRTGVDSERPSTRERAWLAMTMG